MSRGEKLEGARQSPEHQKSPSEWGKRFRRMCMALAIAMGGATAVDALGVGTRRMDVHAEYAASIERARAGYERYIKQQLENPDGPMPVSSFSDYLHNIEMMPTPEEVAAVERLMSEYDRPIRVYSGTRLFTRLFEVLFATGDRAGHYRPEGIFFNEHGIYLGHREREQGAPPMLSRGDLAIIVAELSHAFQNEKGTLSLSRVVGDLTGMVLRGERYNDLYDRPGTYEREAHHAIERMLQNQVTLYESERSVRAYFPAFIEQAGLSGDFSAPITQENFPYERYEELVQRLVATINTPSLRQTEKGRAAEAILAFFELLEGFSGENRPDDEAVPTFVIHPNVAHYRAMMQVLEERTREETPITVRRTIPPPETAQDALLAWREAVLAAKRFEEMNGAMFAVYLNDAKILPEGRQFTRDTYERMMRRLTEAYAMVQFAPGAMTNEGAALVGLIELTNKVCYFDRQCTGRYGILPMENGERSTMGVTQVETLAGEEHYEALRRLFNRHRGSHGARELIDQR